MNADEKVTTITQCVYLLGDAFAKKVSEITVTAYAMGLDGLDAGQVKEATVRALAECRFMPTPAELRELAGVPSAPDRAVIAWDAFLRAVPLGAYKSVDFADKALNATVRNLGGWPACLSRLAEGGAESEKWLRKEFIDTYRAIDRIGLAGDAGAPLPGLSQATVVAGALCSPIPIRCGVDHNNRLTLANH